MNPLDPRITPARPDLAAKHLEGQVEADRFVEGEVRDVIAAQAPVRREPQPDAMLDTEALKGERVIVYETTEEGWSWGQLLADGYVGWLPSDALREAARCGNPSGLGDPHVRFPGAFNQASTNRIAIAGKRLLIVRTEPPFAVTATNGFVPLRHLSEAGERERDFVAVAERFVGVPYLWGGKTSLGLDCSALVQVALTAAGDPCPRDSDMQEAFLGLPFKPESDFSNLKRGDFLFWKDHVAIARDNTTLIHANAHHMAVAIEPIAEAVARIRAAGSELVSVRRIRNIIQ